MGVDYEPDGLAEFSMHLVISVRASEKSVLLSFTPLLDTAKRFL
jgi:hypothetical protein